MLRDGGALTVAGAAQEARVPSATAYRYFSQPYDPALATVAARAQAVLVDLPAEPSARLDEVVRRLTDLQLEDESMWGTMLALTLERWCSHPPRDGSTPSSTGGSRWHSCSSTDRRR